MVCAEYNRHCVVRRNEYLSVMVHLVCLHRNLRCKAPEAEKAAEPERLLNRLVCAVERPSQRCQWLQLDPALLL